jgi:hypothetical protein
MGPMTSLQGLLERDSHFRIPDAQQESSDEEDEQDPRETLQQIGESPHALAPGGPCQWQSAISPISSTHPGVRGQRRGAGLKRREGRAPPIASDCWSLRAGAYRARARRPAPVGHSQRRSIDQSPKLLTHLSSIPHRQSTEILNRPRIRRPPRSLSPVHGEREGEVETAPRWQPAGPATKRRPVIGPCLVGPCLPCPPPVAAERVPSPPPPPHSPSVPLTLPRRAPPPPTTSSSPRPPVQQRRQRRLHGALPPLRRQRPRGAARRMHAMSACMHSPCMCPDRSPPTDRPAAAPAPRMSLSQPVNLFKLETASLRRYRRVHQLVRPPAI